MGSSLPFSMFHLLTSLALFLHLTTASWLFHLRPYAQQCFYEELRGAKDASFTFQVDDSDGPLEVDFWVSDPDNKLLKVINSESTGTYDFKTVKAGTYQFCFHNVQGGSEEKLVEFAVFGARRPQDKPENEAKENVDPLDRAVDELEEAILAIKDEQQYLILREKLHRQTAESTNSRVAWWSMIQTLLLVGVCLFQVYYLKRFFEVRRVV